MPIKLNLKKPTTVNQDFLDMMVDFWKERWKALNDEILNTDPRMRKFITEKNAVPMSRLRAACTQKTAFDYEKTQLLCLPFEKFWVEDHNGALFIAGLTKPIILSDLGVKRWQGPRYTIWVSRNVSKRATSATFHWVPEGHELEYARHPHHNADHPLRRQVSHPLDMSPNTCWGSFGTMTQSCARAGEVVNLMRTLHLYTSRVNMNSLLTHPFEACPFTPLPDAKAGTTVEMYPEQPASRRRRR